MVESCLRTDDEQYICIRTRTQSCYAGAKLHSKCRKLQQTPLAYKNEPRKYFSITIMFEHVSPVDAARCAAALISCMDDPSQRSVLLCYLWHTYPNIFSVLAVVP
jgi:hypothetical protein